MREVRVGPTFALYTGSAAKSASSWAMGSLGAGCFLFLFPLSEMVRRTTCLSEMRGVALAISASIFSFWAVIRWSWFSTFSSILCNHRGFGFG